MLLREIRKSFLTNSIRARCYIPQCTFSQSQPIQKPNLKFNSSKLRAIGPFGWLLLLVPSCTFALGTWQVQRKKWKEQLISDMQRRKHLQPSQLPVNPKDLEDIEYYPVHVRGKFLHERELLMGPRSLLMKGDTTTESSLMSKRQNTSQGYLVITPFKLEDRNETILINRGWVPSKNRDPNTRQKGQVKETVDVIGLVRLHENRPNFMPPNKDNAWFYRDLEQMSTATGSSPIYLDATDEFNQKDGPIGGQTRISLRNEHMSYIITWYSLCGITSFMWYKQFLRHL